MRFKVLTTLAMTAVVSVLFSGASLLAQEERKGRGDREEGRDQPSPGVHTYAESKYYLGIAFRDVRFTPYPGHTYLGVEILQVHAGSPAAMAKLQPYDIITSVTYGGKKHRVENGRQLVRHLDNSGGTVTIRAWNWPKYDFVDYKDIKLKPITPAPPAAPEP